MDVTLFGIVTDVRPKQPLKTFSPIKVVPSGIIKFVISVSSSL